LKQRITLTPKGINFDPNFSTIVPSVTTLNLFTFLENACALDVLSTAYLRKQELLTSYLPNTFSEVTLPKVDDSMPGKLHLVDLQGQIRDIVSKAASFEDSYQNACLPHYARRWVV
jgi:hypothetical protein